MYRPRTSKEWALLIITTTQALAIAAIDLYILLTYFNWINTVIYQVPGSYVVPVNFALSLLGNIYQCLLALDALRMKNNLQLWSVCVLDACLLVFSIMRYFQSESVVAGLQLGETMGKQPFTNRKMDYWGHVKVPMALGVGVVGTGLVSVLGLSVVLQREFRWVIYRHISGSLEMLRRYVAYQVLLVLLRIEMYFLIGFLILYGLVDVHYVQPEFGLTIAIIPVMMIQATCTIIFTKSENMIGAIAAIIIRLAELAYLSSRIIALSDGGNRSRTLLQDEMLLFASAALALATLACFNAMLCAVNFGKGLKPLLQNESWKRRVHEFEPVNQHRYAERIELD